MLGIPAETDFSPLRRYEGSDQHHAVVARGRASDSPYDRSGGRDRERRQEAPHDEAVLSAQAIEHQQSEAARAAAPSPGPLGALGAWLVQRLDDMGAQKS